MRFERLSIPAFGPFTDLELRFPSQGRDFHLFYGENEAGKSSLLRAIRDLLFGIHAQSSDNFLHDYKDFRLAGEIVSRQGDRLVFQRRKGNKNTLLDEGGNALPESALAHFLGGVRLDYFSTMFGLGSLELREGARQLLRGEGEIGMALFSASLGGTPVQRVLDMFIQESERLFKGRATANVSIRPAVNRYKELLKLSRESMVNPEAWEKLEIERAEKEQVRRCLDEELALLDQQIAWVTRCEDAWPCVVRLREEMHSIQALPPLPELASDFLRRARLARDQVNEFKSKAQMLSTQAGLLEEDLAGCRTAPELLANAESLESSHQNFGSYQTRKEALQELENKLARMEPALRAGMERFGVAGDFPCLQRLRLGSAVTLGCDEAATALREAQKSQSDNAKKVEERKHQIGFLETELNLLPEPDLVPLREALAVAAGALDADKTLAVSKTAVETWTRMVTDQHRVLAGPEDWDSASQLAAPATSTIRKFRERLENIQRAITTEENRIEEEQRKASALRGELSRLERRGELPSEENLRQVRIHRDQGWRLVLAEWKGAGAQEEHVPGVPLEESFPQAINRADEIADQLRLHAEAVAQAEEKRFQIQTSEEAVAEATRKRAELLRSREESQRLWEAEWVASGINPRSPDEMEEWREAWVQFKESLRRLKEAQADLMFKECRIREAKQSLAAVLGDVPEKEFSVLFEGARRSVQNGEELTGRRKLISEQIKSHRDQLRIYEQKEASLREALKAALDRWKSQCRAAGLPEDCSPDSGLILLQERKELLLQYDAWKECFEAKRETAEAVREYEQTVSEQAAALGIQGETTEARQSRLWEALGEARKAKAEQDQLARQIKTAKHQLAEAKQAESGAMQLLDGLMHLARVTTSEELEQLLVHLEKRDELRKRIDGLRETLAGLARGQAVDEFIARVEAENANELPQRKIQLENHKAGKKCELEALLRQLANLNNQKEEFEKAGDAAADYKQQAESVAAQLKQDAARFMRLRLAAHFLRTQIERFREQNQGPLLEKSGQVFKAITRGAFDGLAADFNEQDIPVLVGRRADGSHVPVEGMSDGSRDQLYLALRLAALDRYLEDYEPMPLILDDLLITFDDERTRAILPQLAELAKRSQVFLFTHHQHLIELCREVLAQDHFHLHRLGKG